MESTASLPSYSVLPPPGPPRYATTTTISLDFSKNSVDNTRITGSGLDYEIVTPEITYPGQPLVTSVYSSSAESEEGRVLVGKIDWNFNSDKPIVANVYAAGANSSNVFESARTIINERGDRYQWDIHSDHLVLRDLSSGALDTEPIATLQSQKQNLIGKETRPARLQLSSVAIPSIHKIILSLLVVERRRRDVNQGQQGRWLSGGNTSAGFLSK